MAMPKLAEGTELQVGSHTATVVKYLSEGGYAHIYQVSIAPEENDSEIACLKRVIVPTKAGLNQLRTEVEVMKKLSHCKNVVRYYDSHASKLDENSYEVLLLMELCTNKSLLDYMNSKIKTKLTEPEILKIMFDVCVGVAEMHKKKMIHRDIKIENVLIDADHTFKLCDFGSTSSILRAPRNQQELQLLQNDLIHQTTPQYRSPEMIDLYRGFPIDEKADIWALGVFLYKLCYYTTPFEANGDMAILRAAYQFPQLPSYSGDLKNLIIIMLQESPKLRPNVVQLLIILKKMLGTKYDIEDFYELGPYDFNKLHEYQVKKQQETYLQQQQQQAYYNQQQQQHSVPQVQQQTPGLEVQDRYYRQQFPPSQVQTTLNTPQPTHPKSRSTSRGPEGDRSRGSFEINRHNDDYSDLEDFDNIEERFPSVEKLTDSTTPPSGQPETKPSQLSNPPTHLQTSEMPINSQQGNQFQPPPSPAPFPYLTPQQIGQLTAQQFQQYQFQQQQFQREMYNQMQYQKMMQRAQQQQHQHVPQPQPSNEAPPPVVRQRPHMQPTQVPPDRVSIPSGGESTSQKGPELHSKEAWELASTKQNEIDTDAKKLAEDIFKNSVKGSSLTTAANTDVASSATEIDNQLTTNVKESVVSESRADPKSSSVNYSNKEDTVSQENKPEVKDIASPVSVAGDSNVPIPVDIKSTTTSEPHKPVIIIPDISDIDDSFTFSDVLSPAVKQVFSPQAAEPSPGTIKQVVGTPTSKSSNPFPVSNSVNVNRGYNSPVGSAPMKQQRSGNPWSDYRKPSEPPVVAPSVAPQSVPPIAIEMPKIDFTNPQSRVIPAKDASSRLSVQLNSLKLNDGIMKFSSRKSSDEGQDTDDNIAEEDTSLIDLGIVPSTLDGKSLLKPLVKRLNDVASPISGPYLVSGSGQERSLLDLTLDEMNDMGQDGKRKISASSLNLQEEVVDFGSEEDDDQTPPMADNRMSRLSIRSQVSRNRSKSRKSSGTEKKI